ncbi:MAG: chemotaxis protein CheA [Deltaproteobacteria bacterium]|nr:MAG: chemotaxis protein CheA [Deltaproteobacteria bacterium]
MAARRSRTGPRSKADCDFLAEAEEILERLRADLADLVDQRASGSIQPDTVNGLFRSAHSLKGLAGMFGFDALSDLAHHLEDLLDAMRLGRVPVDRAASDLLEDVVRRIAAALARLDGSAAPDLEGAANLVSQMRAFSAAASEPVGDALDPLDLDPSVIRALTEYEEHRLRDSIRRGRRILMVEATFEVLSFDEGLAELAQDVREVGELLSTLPSPGAAPESQIRFGLLVASDLTAPELARRVERMHATARIVREPRVEGAPSSATRDARGAAEPTAPSPGDTARSGDDVAIESLRSISETVRVDIRKLDELMNLVGELGVQRAALARIVEGLRCEGGVAQLASDAEKVHKAIDRKLQELQARVLDVRMVPLRQVFEKLSRIVRRLRRDLGKDVRLELRGADTELDKWIVEGLCDALVHVVRNAFDHGIEPPQERLAAGKPAQGTIRIEAFQRGNRVVVQVSDDGRGIDVAAVRGRAEALGLVPPDRTLARKQALELILLPGLSTRDEVTETSGRGVGMDVVHTNLASLAGVVDVDSTPGRGSTISMTLPITLAILQVLVVRVAEQCFAVPMNSVLEAIALGASDLQYSGGQQVLNLRGEALPLRWLGRELGVGEPTGDAKPFVVVVQVGDSRIGLLVDELLAEQDAVIKPIQGPVQQIPGIAGATEFGEGGAVLVLDVAAIVHDARARRDAA